MTESEPPTIVVHGSRAIPLALLVGAGCVIGIAIFRMLRRGIFSIEFAVVILVLVGAWLFATQFLIRPRAQLLINSRGIDVVAQQTGVIRWSEIIHVSLFTLPPDGADGLAIFVSDEVAQRLPLGHNSNLPAFADVSLGTNYIALYERDLEYPLRDILAEIEARRRGGVGPLAQHAMKS